MGARFRRSLALALIALTIVSATLCGVAETSFEPLQKGQKGEAVAALQRRLISLGYLHDRADGNYGLKTARAVTAFQRQAELKPTGTADEDTLQELYGESAPEVRVFIAPSGKRYHARANCRGLKQAKSVSETGYTDAVDLKRTPCILCYGRFALRLAMEALESDAPDEAEAPSAE